MGKLATTTNKRKVFSLEGKAEVKRQIGNGNKESWRVSGMSSRKFYDPKYLEISKIISVFEKNGSRIQRFRKPERSYVDETQPKWSKRDKSDNVPVSGPLLIIIIVRPKC